jgi:acid phosphatase family membrane protein YuiD
MISSIFPLSESNREGTIVLLLSTLTWVCALAAKFTTDTISTKKVSATDFLRYGGWPSAHTSSFAGLSTSIFIAQGLSVAFLISGAMTFLVIRDTLTIRPEIDKNSRAVQRKDAKFLSHSFFEIFSGLVFGVFGPLILNYLFTPYYALL